MEKYLLFGVMPIRVSAEGTWTADVSRCPAGEGLKNVAANYLARGVLGFIAILELALGVEIPVRIDAAKYPKGPKPSCRDTLCANRTNCNSV